ncbi:MAG TPA: site-2 protease family protein [Thermoanaerobaculia bacterium]|nr:site-2 protease family protein [Thermoanaerobaculia bacterium]
MKWAWRVGKLAGIDLKIHVTFLLILGWVGLLHWRAEGTTEAVVRGVVFILLLFGCVVLHELGHALTARRFGVKTRDIILLPIGGVARLERMPEKPSQELLVAIAGPLVNVVIAGGLFAVLAAAGRWVPLQELAQEPSITRGPLFQQLAVINVTLAVFNLIPAFPMDGGRILRALLATRLDYVRATQIAAAIGQVFAFGLGFLGLFSNPFLVFIAFFVWIGAAQEASAVELRNRLEGISVGQVMLTDFRALHPFDTLSNAIDLTMAGSQVDFPVVDSGRAIGVLTQQKLLAALRGGGPEQRVQTVMEREFEHADPHDLVEPLLQRLQEKRQRTVPVVAHDSLVGLLTVDNIGEYFAIQSALKKAGG